MCIRQRFLNRFAVISTLVFLSLILIPTEQQAQQPQSGQQSVKSAEIFYTQNIQEFKSTKYNQRLEIVVGCWLLSKQYLNDYKANYLFFKDLNLKEIVLLKLVKECMKIITRKDAVLKITELVGKNVEPAKKYGDLIQNQVIDGVFAEVSRLTIATYHQYQPINKQDMPTNMQNIADNQSAKAQSNQSNSQINQQQRQEQTPSQNDTEVQQSQETPNPLENLSEFDTFLIDLINKYNQEFQKLITSKQGLKARVEQELKKREKYYFGFIPASSFTHSVFLVTISLSMVFCCTCYKYYKKRESERVERKKKMGEENSEDSHSHSHLKNKEIRKITRMSQLTMKKKSR